MAQGEYYSSSHIVSFHRVVTTEAERIRELRTDERFRNRFQPEHHAAERSILERLPIDMVKMFIIADALHLIDLGLTKRYIYRWNIFQLVYLYVNTRVTI